MDGNTLRLSDPAPVPPHGERRCSIRQKLHTPVYVSFNGPQSGVVVDLSELLDLHENGFAVQTAVPTDLQRDERLEVDRAVTLCLELPETRKYLHGSGQVMWADDNGRAGIRFSFLPEGSRQILKEWLFANLLVASTNHAARAEQITHREQEESPLHELAARELPTQDLFVQDFSAAAKSPAPMPMSDSKATGVALLDQEDLPAALDDVRREIRAIEARNVDPPGNIDPILQLITERGISLTGATGGALALRTGDKTTCRARAGDPAPPIGSEVDVRAGLSGECVRHGLLVSCEDPEIDSRVDPKICRALGIGSFVAAPIFTDSRVVGLLEIFSPVPRRFTKLHGTILQRLAELIPQIEDKKTATKTVERKTIPAQTIEAVETERKKTACDTQLNTTQPEIDDQKIDRQTVEHQIEHQKIEPGGGQSNLPELNSLDATVRPIDETRPAPSLKEAIAEYEIPDLQNSDDTRSHAIARPPYLIQVSILLLVLGTVAMVMGYLLAPTIQKRWLPRSAQNSSPAAGQNSQQAFSKSSLTSSSLPVPSASDRRGHSLSPDDLRKLGEQGDAESQYQLGILYHDGVVVPKDDAQAVQWFHRAAEQGYVRAQSTLGAYYWAGRGVPQDFTKAYFWSQLALAQGDENSKSRLEGLSAQMTQSQVANARQEAEAWLHAHTQATKPNPASK